MKRIIANGVILAVLGSFSCMGVASGYGSDALDGFNLPTLLDDDGYSGAVFGSVLKREIRKIESFNLMSGSQKKP